MSKFMQEKAKEQRKQIGDEYRQHMKMHDLFPQLEMDFDKKELSLEDREQLLDQFTNRLLHSCPPHVTSTNVLGEMSSMSRCEL